ncbi:MAG: DUF4399 domain-containing protein [Gammaproteobacteria bacterium]|jgi:hypothetical protein
MNLKLILFSSILMLMTSATYANELISKSSPDAKVYFIEPVDGATVSKTFTVKFGLSGMGVAPAGVNKENTGHHHLLINTELADYTKPIGASDKMIHFGGGQTETEITLPEGKHTLQLVLGNYVHIPHDKPVKSEKITINVK